MCMCEYECGNMGVSGVGMSVAESGCKCECECRWWVRV